MPPVEQKAGATSGAASLLVVSLQRKRRKAPPVAAALAVHAPAIDSHHDVAELVGLRPRKLRPGQRQRLKVPEAPGLAGEGPVDGRPVQIHLLKLLQIATDD